MNNRNELHMAEGGLLPFDPIVLLLDVLKRWLAILAVVLLFSLLQSSQR